MEKVFVTWHSGSAVATGAKTVPPQRLLVPPISVYSKSVFGISRNDKTTDNDKKGKITFKHNSLLTFFRFFCENAFKQLLQINATQ